VSERLRTQLCSDFGIRYPILLAGMGVKGRATPPALVAAVCEAGGMGFLGCSWLDADEVRRRIRAVRELTDRPFGVNLLLPASMADAAPDRAEMRARLARDHPKHVAFVRSMMEDFGLAPHVAEGGVMSPDFIRRQVDVLLDERVSVFAAGLGDPAWVVPLAHQAGLRVIGLAGSVRNAARQIRAGVDYIVAQGYEAGGHVGKIASLALIPQVVDAVRPVPVIAAGGIADGRGLVAVLALGAVGAWIGSAFLLAEESAIYREHQEEIIRGAAEDFVVTRAYTGKTARDYRNAAIDRWENSGLSPLPMPLQGVLMDDFVAAAEMAGRPELINNPAGQAVGLLTRRRPAREIIDTIVREAEEVLGRLASLEGHPLTDASVVTGILHDRPNK